MKRVWILALVMVFLISIVVPATLTFAKSKKIATHEPATVPDLEEKYQTAADGKHPVHILIVPGHEPGFGGAEYKGIYEREITVEIADQLAAYLKENPRLDIVVARSGESWNENISDYFDDKWFTIQSFVKEKKKAFSRLVRRGKMEKRGDDDQVAHATAPTEVALRLYGINAWANENDVDLVVHLHINDAPDHKPNAPSENSGFAVYVPDAQYENAATSLPLGKAVAARLSALSATSTLAVENKGVVEDQELIALGAYDTLSVPSVLIEYSYITEPRFADPDIRPILAKDYAFETSLGILDFFNASPSIRYSTTALPFTFASSSIGKIGSSTPGTYALQAALHSLNLYPTFSSSTPKNARLMAPTLTTCPIDGVMSKCTVYGIEAFQTAKGFETTGKLGPKTVSALNALFAAP